ncbi:carbon-nitrogen hydrolase [Aspergillus bertholletiae]|uniref:nitrilase n=1 Tax=Aspergillus bertholletiae TaxID=1226010 RepID=A0A5N7BMT9_9EURO|nr:carbon-nitrogen hydrolase [Aspergillus bertholletiae]
MGRIIRVAAVQAEPVWNNLQGAVDKTISIIQSAANEGANVIGFPEVWIPGFPWSIWSRGAVENTPYMNEYFKNSLERESPEMDRIRLAVKEAGMFCVLGYSERNRGSLYMAQTFIDENGDIIHHRRKMKPTHIERGYWGDGQGESIRPVANTSFGNIGALNCWEHLQPLLKYLEYSQDVEIHVASWPPIWDKQEGIEWADHMTAEMSTKICQTMAVEGTCFVLVCTQVMSEESKKKNNLEDFKFTQCPGGGFSMIFDAFGKPLVKALPSGEEGILYADVDLDLKRQAQQSLDVVGHYSRPDLLSLTVNATEARPVTRIQDNNNSH